MEIDVEGKREGGTAGDEGNRGSIGGSATRNTIAEESGIDRSKRSPLRKVGRAVLGVTGAGVVSKDLKRVKPRYPQMWKDLVSVRVWKERFSTPSVTQRPLMADIGISLITVGFSLLLIIYGVGLATSPSWQTDMPTINKIGLFVLIVLSMVQGVCHMLIIALKIRNRAQYGSGVSANDETAGTADTKGDKA
jgi:hypothetical protein